MECLQFSLKFRDLLLEEIRQASRLYLAGRRIGYLIPLFNPLKNPVFFRGSRNQGDEPLQSLFHAFCPCRVALEVPERLAEPPVFWFC